MEIHVIPDTVKANVLMAVAGGSSVSEAARANGITPNQGRESISRLCRSLKLSSDVSEIRAHPKKYIESASKVAGDPKYALSKGLREKMQRLLRLRPPAELTPRYLSNITAEALLSVGITPGALADIQGWMLDNGTALKRRAPAGVQYTQMAKRALLLLDAFGFDVAKAASQLKRARRGVVNRSAGLPKQ
jgi:hypothetical protein